MVKEIENKSEFIKQVFDFENNKEWKFEGSKPTIIKFGAPWCNPCKTVAPILEELSKEFEGKVDVYSVDVDEQHEIASALGIQNLPTIVFIPINEQPQMTVGAIQKSGFVKAINEVLKVTE